MKSKNLWGKELAFKTRTQTQIQQLTTALHISLALAEGTSGYRSKHRGGWVNSRIGVSATVGRQLSSNRLSPHQGSRFSR